MTLYLLPEECNYDLCESVDDPDPAPADGWVRVKIEGKSVPAGAGVVRLLDMPADQLTRVPPEPDAPFLHCHAPDLLNPEAGFIKRTESDGIVTWREDHGGRYTWPELFRSAARRRYTLRALVYAAGEA